MAVLVALLVSWGHFAQNLLTSFYKKEGNQIMDMETTHLAERVRLNWFYGYVHLLTYFSKSDFRWTNILYLIIITSSQAAELGDTGREVVLWVAMGLALWQLLMFAASIFLQGKIRFFRAFSISHQVRPYVCRTIVDCILIFYEFKEWAGVKMSNSSTDWQEHSAPPRRCHLHPMPAEN